MRKILRTLLLVALAVSCACFFAVGCGGPKEEMQITVENVTDGTVAVDYDGSPKAVTLSGVPEGVNVTVLYESEAYQSSAAAPTDVGEYKVTVKADANKTYKAFQTEVKLVIGKVQNTFEFTCPDFYVGDTITPEVTENASNGSVTYKYKGRDGTTYDESETAPTEIGKYTVTATVAGTNNYYGAQRTANFEIHSTDPLYGVPDAVKGSVANLTRYENVTLGKSSWNTNKNSTLLKNGVLKVNNECFMLNVPVGSDSIVYLLVNSSAATTAHFRFTVNDAYKYQDIVENGPEYCKVYSAVTVAEGYQLLAVPASNFAGFTGDKDAPITGFHVILAPTVADTEIEFTVHGVYYKNLSLDAVPEEITEQVEGKVKLEAALAPASYYTNSNVVVKDGIFDAVKCGLSLKVTDIYDKVYLIVCSDVAQTMKVRTGVKTGWDNGSMINTPDANVKSANENIAVVVGYQLLEVPLTKWSTAINQYEPVTCLYFWGQGLIDNGLTVFGVYVDKYDGIPDSVMINTVDKQKLELALAEASENTNVADKVTLNEGVIACTGSKLAVNVTGVKDKVYLLVKSAAEAEFDLYAYIENGGTYANAVTGAATYSKYKNTLTFAAGYSFVEVALTAFAEYTGDAEAAIAGLFFDKDGGFAEGIEIHGIYIDEEIPEGIPQEILDAVASKTKLEVTLAPQSYYTNVPPEQNSGKGVAMNEDGVISTDGIWISVDIQPQKFNKVYLLVNANQAMSMRVIALIEGCNVYDKILTVDANRIYDNMGINVVKGYQLLEITLAPYYNQHTEEDIGCLFFAENANFAGGIEIHGIYID